MVLAVLRRVFVYGLIVGATLAAGQTVPGRTVTGRVVLGGLGETNPVRRVHVVLSGPVSVSTDADPDGVFHLNGLAPGRYDVVATKPGFVQGMPAVVDVAAGAGELTVTVVMTRAGAVAGRVIDRSGTAIADTIVFLGGGRSRSELLTDDRGVFRFHTLRDGPYKIWVAGEDESSARPVTIVAGRNEELQIVVPWNAPDSSAAADAGPAPPDPGQEPLTPGAHAIRGRITSAETGAPIPQANVRIMCEGPMQSAQTSASGRYLFRDVPAGPCLLGVSATSKYDTIFYGQLGPLDRPTEILVRDQAVIDVNLELPELKSLSGRLVDEFGDPAPNVTVVVLRAILGAGKFRFIPFAIGGGQGAGVLTNDLGEFRLRNVPPGNTCFLMALSGPFTDVAGGPLGTQGRGYGFAPTFFPGTAVPGDAQPISIERRGEMASLVMGLVPAQMGTVAGRVVDRSGSPQTSAPVIIYQLHGDDIRMLVPARATTDARGNFSIENVPSGRYVAQTFGPDGFASRILTVAPEETPPIDLVVSSPATVRGRLMFDGVADSKSLLKQIHILAIPTDFVRGPAGTTAPPALINEDGTFEVQRMIGFNVLTFMLPSPWMLVSMTAPGADMTDRPFDSSAGDVDGVVVRLSQQVTKVTGTMSGANGQPAANGFVLIFPQDGRMWTYPSRGVRGLDTTAQGSFSATGLPPGAYRAVPFDRIPRPDWMNPEFLQTIQGLGQGFTIGMGESVTVRLELRK